jgi:hypothetical protein
MRKTLYLGVLLILFSSGCATERSATPTLSASPRTSITIKNPVVAAVSDDRKAGGDSGAASSLRAELAQVYGDNLRWAPYSESVPKGDVSLKISIIKLGSSFGNRLISPADYASALKSARAKAKGPWRAVVDSAAKSSTVYGGTFTGDGWWNGAAWVDIEVHDNRRASPIRFTIPLAAEYRVSNRWWHYSGDKAARKAWENVSVQLTQAIDEVLQMVRK